MPTFAVFGRSLFAFVVIAVLAIAAFLFSDTSELREGMLDEEQTSAPESAEVTQPDSVGAEPPSTAPATTLASAAEPEDTTDLDPVVVSVDDLPQTGTGAFVPALTTNGSTVGAGNIIEFSVSAEQESGIDPDELAAFVDQVLGDQRSWIAEGNVGFRRIETGGLFTLVVATAETVDRLCRPLRTNGFFSCARNGWVALNLNRWMTATDTWTGDLTEYRNYVINHEVGHYLARPHVGCPSSGALAPVMMQQTKGLGDCKANGWPYPAPDVELEQSE